MCRKIEECKFLDQFDAKRNFQDEIIKTATREGPNCTILLQHSAQGADCKKFKKFREKQRFAKNWVFEP